LTLKQTVMTVRKQRQTAKMCIFCTRNASSKEHIWSEWMHDLLPLQSAFTKHNRHLYTYHPTTGHKLTGPSERQGDLRTVRIRAVCRECNFGWMNDIEQIARPALTLLIGGAPATLNEDQIAAVALWVTLKCRA
jgi:hypothetical protein